EMQRIGGPQRNVPADRHEQSLRLTMTVPRDLGATELAGADVAQPSLVYPCRMGGGEVGFPQGPGNRRRQLRDGEIGNDDVAATEERILELVAPGLWEVELRQRAGIEIDGATGDLHARARRSRREAAP